MTRQPVEGRGENVRSGVRIDREQGQLVVNGRAVLIRGAELHNSSSSTAAFMGDRWPRLVEIGCNTVLAAVTWELFEPVEGQFDPTGVDELLAAAHTHGLKLVVALVR